MFGVNLASKLKIYAGTAIPKVCLSSGFSGRKKDEKWTEKERSPVNASIYIFDSDIVCQMQLMIIKGKKFVLCV